MCGRFALFIDLKTLIEHFALDIADPQDDLTPRYNIAPSQQVMGICRDVEGRRRPRWFRWGLIPHWAKDAGMGQRLINARSETVHQKPSFRSALRHRRCLIPANGFFEWQQTPSGKQPWFIRRKDLKPLAFAGLWEHWSGPEGPIDSCTILTTEANPLIAKLHDRMPVMLSAADYDSWLDVQLQDPDLLQPLFRPSAADELEMHPVSTVVNNPRHEGEGCVVQVEET
jgi:putative SOS response-associated peptidase YedK